MHVDRRRAIERIVFALQRVVVPKRGIGDLADVALRAAANGLVPDRSVRIVIGVRFVARRRTTQRKLRVALALEISLLDRLAQKFCAEIVRIDGESVFVRGAFAAASPPRLGGDLRLPKVWVAALLLGSHG